MNAKDMVAGQCYSIETTMSPYPYHVFNVTHHDDGIEADYDSVLVRGLVWPGFFGYDEILSVTAHA